MAKVQKQSDHFNECTRMVGCRSFTSLQHLRSYQGGYQLVTVHTHGDIVVLPHWEVRLLVP